MENGATVQGYGRERRAGRRELRPRDGDLHLKPPRLVEAKGRLAGRVTVGYRPLPTDSMGSTTKLHPLPIETTDCGETATQSSPSVSLSDATICGRRRLRVRRRQ